MRRVRWRSCAWRTPRGVETERPVKTARKQTPHYDVTAALIQDPGGAFLIVRRPAEGLLGGLWGFPGSAAGDCDQAGDRV